GSNGPQLTYGAGGSKWFTVDDHTVPRRESRTSWRSVESHSGFRQNASSRGKKYVPQAAQRVPSSAGSPSIASQPSIAATRVLPGIARDSDIPSEFTEGRCSDPCPHDELGAHSDDAGAFLFRAPIRRH